MCVCFQATEIKFGGGGSFTEIIWDENIIWDDKYLKVNVTFSFINPRLFF